MEDAIAHSALRRLSIDIANLTSQLAVIQATAEYVVQVADGLRPDEWLAVEGQDIGGNHEMQFRLRGDQVNTLTALLAALDTLG